MALHLHPAFPEDDRTSASHNMIWLLYAAVIVAAAVLSGQFPTAYNWVASFAGLPLLEESVSTKIFSIVFGAQFTFVVIHGISSRAIATRTTADTTAKIAQVVRTEIEAKLGDSILRLVVPAHEGEAAVAASYLRLVREHLQRLQRETPALQTASLVLLSSYFDRWSADMKKLLTTGVPMESTIRCDMTRALVIQSRHYTFIEQFVSDPSESHTGQFMQLFRDMKGWPHVSKEWVVCCDIKLLSDGDRETLQRASTYMADEYDITAYVYDTAQCPLDLKKALNPNHVLEFFGDRVLKYLEMTSRNYRDLNDAVTHFSELQEGSLYLRLYREIGSGRKHVSAVMAKKGRQKKPTQPAHTVGQSPPAPQ